MSSVSTTEIEWRLQYFGTRRQQIAEERARGEGRLPRHQWWRDSYYQFPYLIGAPNERIANRFCDVFMNTAELDSAGSLIPRMGMDDETPLIEKFAHLMEEWSVRGGVPTDVVARARTPFTRYFKSGNPVGKNAFANFHAPPNPFLVKYSRMEFLEPMLKKGTLRICPASFYNSSTHLDSIRDTETAKEFYIPTFRQRIRGERTFQFRGLTAQFNDDDLRIPITVSDYFLFCLSDNLYYRLPTDFGATAALIIRDPTRFSQLLVSTFLAIRPEWRPFVGKVTYYDPYMDYTKVSTPEMSKHFGYSYQGEYRVAFRSNVPIRGSLQPELITIGSMEDYAEIIEP